MAFADSGQVVAAIIGAGSALAVTIVAPFITTQFEQRRLRRQRREVVIAKLRGLARAMPHLALIRISAEVNIHLAGAFLRETEDAAIRQYLLAETGNQRDTANQAIVQLLGAQRETFEYLAEVRWLFRPTPQVRECMDELARWVFPTAQEPPGQFDSMKEAMAWREHAIQVGHDGAVRLFERPMLTIVRELEAQIHGNPLPTSSPP